MRKIPFAGVELTSQRVKGLRGTSELPGVSTVIREMAQACYKLLIRVMRVLSVENGAYR